MDIETAGQTSDYEPPESTAWDKAHLAARTTIAAAPWIGGAGVELFSAIVTPPLERRRDEWMHEVGDALQRLEQDSGIDLEALSENEVFLDTVLAASQIAMRTSRQEKKDALRNAILNASLPHAPEESRQQFFLHLVDSFTVWHLRLLKLFGDPSEWFQQHNVSWPNLYSGGLSTILETAHPELANERAFYDQVWRDLSNSGLVTTDHLHAMMTENGLKAQRTSGLGNEFLSFIESPDVE